MGERTREVRGRQERWLSEAHGVRQEVATLALFPARKSVKGHKENINNSGLAFWQSRYICSSKLQQNGGSVKSFRMYVLSNFPHEAPGLLCGCALSSQGAGSATCAVPT